MVVLLVSTCTADVELSVPDYFDYMLHWTTLR